MIKLNDILTEIGESNVKPFKWRKTMGMSAKRFKEKMKKAYSTDHHDDYNAFEFTTNKGTQYVVDIEINSVPSTKTDVHTFSIECEIDFSTKNKVNRPSMDATNMHEQYAVMATITDLFKKWVNEWDKELYINKITVDPVGGEDDNSDGDRTANKRGRLYQAFMKKQLSKLNKKYHVRVFGNHFEISPTFTNPLDK